MLQAGIKVSLIGERKGYCISNVIYISVLENSVILGMWNFGFNILFEKSYIYL